MLAFNFFFLPPVHTFTLADSENWFALAVYLVVAVVVSELAARVAAARRARPSSASARRRCWPSIATALLSGRRRRRRRSDAIAAEVGEVLGAAARGIELGRRREPPPGESPLELEAAGRRRRHALRCARAAAPNLAVRRRFLPALASLLAVAIDRERLAREALEAEALRAATRSRRRCCAPSATTCARR